MDRSIEVLAENEIIQTLAEKVQGQDILVFLAFVVLFLVILGLFAIIAFQESSFRKKDRQQSADLLSLVGAIDGFRSTLHRQNELLRFLAMASRDEKIVEGKTTKNKSSN